MLLLRGRSMLSTHEFILNKSRECLCEESTNARISFFFGMRLEWRDHSRKLYVLRTVFCFIIVVTGISCSKSMKRVQLELASLCASNAYYRVGWFVSINHRFNIPKKLIISMREITQSWRPIEGAHAITA